MKKSTLINYAKLIVDTGLNVQSGQDVIISASTYNSDFALLCVKECYLKGARKVTVEWRNQELDKINYNYRSLETLKEIEKWEIEKTESRVKKLPCFLLLEDDDPEGLMGVNLSKMGEALEYRSLKLKKYRDKMDGKYQWCIAALASPGWAKKLFPTLSKKKALEALWEKILLSSRVLDDPISEWKKHDEDLKKRCAYLNSLNIDALHYTSMEGTDFTVGLIENSQFLGGGEYTVGPRRVYFQPNIPSEECFISPKKGRAEGKLVATLPLCYRGALIENFWIRFEEGKAVEWGAEKNEELLSRLLKMDKGASYLGECALVPNSSPIRQSGILFYNTLFDENATCHIAFGAGFENTLKDYESLSKKECHERGINDSVVHVDFMIGSDTLSIDAITRDGKKVAIFRNGEWAF